MSKMKMKKKISLYLAVIMLFNVLMPFATPMRLRVYASAPDFTVERGSGLRYGVAPPPHVPELLAPGESPATDHVHYSFPIGAVGSTDAYRLSYVTQEGWVVNVHAVVSQGSLIVEYFVSQPPGTPALPLAHFAVHNTPDVPGARNFVPIGEYLQTPPTIRPMPYPDGLMGYVIGVTGDFIPPNPMPPRFSLPMGAIVNTGFSFMIFGREVHIKLQPAPGPGYPSTFHFASNGFAPGFVYDIGLERLDPVFNMVDPDAPYFDMDDVRNWGSVGDRSFMLVNTGLDGAAIRPFANHGNVGPNLGRRFLEQSRINDGRLGSAHRPYVIHHSRYLDPQAPDNPVDLGVTPQPLNEWPRWPAMQEEALGFIIEFYLPEDTVTGDTFIHPDSTPMDARLEIGGSSIGFRINNIFNIPTDTVVGSTVGLSHIVPDGGMFEVVGARRVPGTARIEIVIEVIDDNDFLPSLIFEGPSHIIILDEGGHDVYTRPTPLPRANTFLNFEVYILNGNYYVEFIPFTNQNRSATIPGVYILAESTEMGFTFAFASAPQIVGAGPPTPIRIPIDGDVLGRSGRYLQMIFLPGTPINVVDAVNVIRGGGIPSAALSPLVSQVLWFRGSPYDINLTIPERFSVVLDNHSPKFGDVTRQTGDADLTVSWSLGTTGMINTLHNRRADSAGVMYIDYEIDWSLYGPDPSRPEPQLFTIVRATITSNAALSVPQVRFSLIRVDAAGNRHEVDEIEGIRLQESSFAPRDLIPSAGHYMAIIELQVDTYHEVLEHVVPPRGLRFPAVHHMRLGPVAMSDRFGAIEVFHPDVRAGLRSSWDDFPLSDFDDPQVPPPQNLRIENETIYTVARGDDLDRVSFDISWEIPGAQIWNYLVQSYGLFPTEGWENEFRFEMNIYISEDEEFMREYFSRRADPIGNRHHIYRAGPPSRARTQVFDAPAGLYPASGRPAEGILGLPGIPGDANTFYFSQLNVENPNNVGMPIEALRNRDVVAIRGLQLSETQLAAAITSPTALEVGQMQEPYAISFRLDGLDKNQQYFVYVDFVITQYMDPNHPDFDIVHWRQNGVDGRAAASFLSNLAGVTMPDDPQIPDGVDRDPPGVVLNVEEDSVTISSAILYWDIVQALPIPPDYTQIIEYEMIRVQDNQIPPEQLDNRDAFGQVWNAIIGAYPENTIVGWRTSGSALQGWTGTAWGGTPDRMRIMIERGIDPTIYLLDYSLASNTLYFYYIRVVRTVYGPSFPNGITTRSVWSHATVTTDIAGAPRNLRVESEREYDRMHEVMISFEAPLYYGSLPALLGITNPQGVRIEYQLRIDEEPWMSPVLMNDTVLRQHAQARPTEDGVPWTWFLYHIRGLEAGQRYTVRVRLVEFRGGSRMSESMWSNEVSWITDTDPEEDDYRRREDDWEDYLRRRLEELLRRPYWIIRQDPNAFQVIYRINMFNNIVATAPGGHIHLPFVDARQTTYYIPYAAFRMAWDRELAFVMTNPYGNMQILVPSRSIDLFDNDQVIDIGVGIRRGEFTDYMVRFNIDWSTPPYIQGEETLTYVADVGFDLVSTVPNILPWEQRVEQDLRDRIVGLASSEYARNLISEAVRGGIPAEDTSREMVRIVEDVAARLMASIVNEHFRVGGQSLTARSRALEVPRLDRSMSIRTISGPNIAAIEAYQSPGGNLWSNVPTLDTGDGEGIFTSLPGQFVFTGRIVVIQGIEEVQGGPVATGVVARHGLDDFFGRADMNVQQTATRSQLVNSVARMMGAPRGTDPVPWLRANGVNVQAAGMNNPITNQSAIQLIMTVYAAQTGTRVDSLRITNFATVNNLTGLEPHYRTYVAAAIELGLVSANNLQPGAQLSVGQLLEILAVLDRLVGL